MAKKTAVKKVRITLVRSFIGRQPKHRRTAEALGLRRIGRSVERDMNESTLGMVRSLGHMVRVEEIG
ncbi:MAG: 50S ribosomal protein L30 [Spirochaetaceae bacterium]